MTAGVWSMEALRVLGLLRNGLPLHGWAVCRTTGLGSGTVYPILRRFAAQGWVTSRTEFFEDALDPEYHGGAPRVFYQITTGGLDQVAQLRALVST